MALTNLYGGGMGSSMPAGIATPGQYGTMPAAVPGLTGVAPGVISGAAVPNMTGVMPTQQATPAISNLTGLAPGQVAPGAQTGYLGGAMMTPSQVASMPANTQYMGGALTLPGQVQPATGNAAMAVASPAGQQGQAQQATTPTATNQAAPTNQVAPQYRGLTRSNMANQQTQGSFTPGQNYLSQYYKQLRGSLPQNGFGTRF